MVNSVKSDEQAKRLQEIAWAAVTGVAFNTVHASEPQPVRLIFDTDMMGDVDDVGAAAVLHALCDTALDAKRLAEFLKSRIGGQSRPATIHRG
jgi:hypothetical protein